jgi:hypothetical protein
MGVENEQDDEPGLKPVNVKQPRTVLQEDDEDIEVIVEGEESDKRKPPKKADVSDERVGAGRDVEAGDENDDDDEERERKREANRRAKLEKKARQKAAIERDRREKAYLIERNESLEKRVAEIQRGQRRTEVGQVDQHISSLEANIAQANTIIGQATAAQSAEDVAQATQIKDDLMEKLRQARAYRQQMLQTVQREQQQAQENGGGQQQQRRPQNGQTPAPSQELVRQAGRFGKRHAWFDPSSGDEESSVVLALDHALTREGDYDPETPEYWAELERRASKYLPHRFKKAAASTEDEDDDDLDDDDDEVTPPARGKAPARGGPRMSNGGGTAAGGKKVYRISAARRSELEKHGLWDDIKVRNRYIKKFQEWDAENASSR